MHKILWVPCGFVCEMFALNVHMYRRKNHAQNTMGALWFCVKFLLWIFTCTVESTMGALCFKCTHAKKEPCTNTMGALWFCVWFFALNVHKYSWKNHAQNTMGALWFLCDLFLHLFMFVHWCIMLWELKMNLINSYYNHQFIVVFNACSLGKHK